MKYVIIGAGPAGLTAGLLLARRGHEVRIIEKEAQVGGISRTVRYKKYRFDLGGHRFFAKFPQIRQFWLDMLPNDLIQVERRSHIFYKGKFLSYPLDPKNALGNLGYWQSFAIFASYIVGKTKKGSPKTLADVYVRGFGRRLYRKFFESYSTRLWGIPPEKMEPDWGFQRAGKLSLLGAVKDAFFPRPDKIKSLIKTFRYPRFGPGQMWEKVAREYAHDGGKLIVGDPVVEVHHRYGSVDAVKTASGKSYKVGQLISSAPLKDFVLMLNPKPEESVVKAAKRLKYRDFILVALAVKKKKIFSDQWIYIQDPGYRCVRVQNINNWSKDMVGKPGITVLGVEYVTSEKEPLWKMSDQELISLAQEEIIKLGFARLRQFVDATVVRQLKAYPVYDLGYRKNLEKVKAYLSKIKNFTPVGRNGMHKYNNMDHSMLIAMKAVENLFGGKNDLWQINTEMEYLEKK